MKPRNPPRSRGRMRKMRCREEPRTPGHMLFQMMQASPLTGEPKLKLLMAAAGAITAEIRAGMWSD